MSKVIDYDKIVRDSFLKAKKDLGLVQEVTVETPSPQSRKWGSKVYTEYKHLDTMLRPLRSEAGVTGVANLEQIKKIISVINKVLGMREEVVAGVKTGLTTAEQQTAQNAKLSTIVSSLYLQRLLYSVLHEQQANVAGRMFEGLMAVLLLGETSGEHKPIEDIYINDGQDYISLKAITSSGGIDGSVANLAKSLASSPNKVVEYFIAVKDQAESATKINFFSFKITKESFFQFVNPELKIFQEGSVDLTSDGLNFLKSILEMNYQEVIDAIKLGKRNFPLRENLQELKLKELHKVADIEKYASQFVIDQEAPKRNLPIVNIDDLVASSKVYSPQEKEKYLKILGDFRGELIKNFKENINNVTEDQYKAIATSLARKLPAFGDTLNTREGLVSYIEDLIPNPSGKSNSIFKSSKLPILEKAIEEATIADLPIETQAQKLAIVAAYDKADISEKYEQSFRNELKKLMDIYPELEIKYSQDFEDRTFRSIYSSYEDHKEKTIARSFPKQRSVTAYNSLLIILDREFLNRLPDYKRKSIEYKKAILPAFMSIFDFLEQVNKYIYEKSAEKPKELNKQQFNSDDANVAEQRKTFLDVLFGGPATLDARGRLSDASPARAKAGRFSYKLREVLELGFDIDENYETIFLEERELFQSADKNMKLFGEFVEPFNRNALALKEGWDKYILEDQPEGMVQVQTSLTDIRKHIKKFAVSPTETEITEPEIKDFKKASELTELLNMTREAAIVLEMLQRMEE